MYEGIDAIIAVLNQPKRCIQCDAPGRMLCDACLAERTRFLQEAEASVLVIGYSDTKVVKENITPPVE